MQIQRHQGVAALLHLADQPLDLLGVQQQLAAARRIGDEMRRNRGEGADVGADQEQLAAAHRDIAVGELGAAAADRLDFPAVERQARLVALFDEIIVKRLAVLDYGHAAF